jgi:hypothetical protein
MLKVLNILPYKLLTSLLLTRKDFGCKLILSFLWARSLRLYGEDIVYMYIATDYGDIKIAPFADIFE